MLGACADRGGEWPSLARVPGSPNVPCGPAAESPPASQSTGPRPCVAAPPAAEAPSTPAPELDLPALESRLAAVRGAWAEALKAAETAVAGAAHADAGESAWAAAELQLSRLERAAVPFGEIAEALGGSESGAALRAATEAERARHLEAFARLRAALRR